MFSEHLNQPYHALIKVNHKLLIDGWDVVADELIKVSLGLEYLADFEHVAVIRYELTELLHVLLLHVEKFLLLNADLNFQAFDHFFSPFIWSIHK